MTPEQAQSVLIAVVGFVLLVCAWTGWRQGVVRMIAGVVSLVAAYLAGWIGGLALVPVLRPFFTAPDLALRVGAGALLGFATYFVLKGIAAILFKRTGQQEVGIVKLGYGVFGACVGLLYGMVAVAVIFVGLRLVGTVAEADVAGAKKAKRAGKNGQPAVWVKSIADLKTALETSPVAPVVRAVDPVPESVHSTISKLMRVTGNPDQLERLIRHPSFTAVMNDPNLTAISRQSDIAEKARAGDFIGLIRDPRIIAAANDPTFAQRFRIADLDKALDDTLAAQTSETRLEK